MSPKSILCFALLAIASTALSKPIVLDKPLVNFQLTRRLLVGHPPDYILKSDQARAAALIQKPKNLLSGNLPKRDGISTEATNIAVTYVVNIGVGSPPTNYTIIVDTGSSNTWIGANSKYRRTSTSIDTGNNVSVSYGSGSFSGKEYLDSVTLGNGLDIKNQSIGVAYFSDGFDDVDGILGIGPKELTRGTLSSGDKIVPTVTDNLYTQGVINSNMVSISFNPTTTDSNENGALTFGGVDESKYTGEITYVPITTRSPASDFWGIDQSITYGNGSSGPSLLPKTILHDTSGIVDTGTTLILLSPIAFLTYVAATGAVLDPESGLLRLTEEQFAKLQSLYFHIGGETFELTPNAQIWPRSLNEYIGGKSGDIFLIVNSLPAETTGSGLDFINGYAFLERYYSIYDTEKRRLGLATTPYTFATAN